MSEHEDIASLREWLNTESGLYARAWEQQQINHFLSNVFGYHAIQIGMPHWDLLQNNRILHKWHTHNHNPIETIREGAQLVLCAPEQLPFAAESIDLLVLPHVLEAASDPHQVLREVQRVLVPEGKVVLSGFNPWSLWGLRDRLPGLECLLPVEPQYQISHGRVADWLEVLSFEVTDEVTGCYRPLCSELKWLQRWRFMDKLGARWWPMLGGIHVLKATKRVGSMTLVGMDWSKKASVTAGGARETAAANSNIHTVEAGHARDDKT